MLDQRIKCHRSLYDILGLASGFGLGRSARAREVGGADLRPTDSALRRLLRLVAKASVRGIAAAVVAVGLVAVSSASFGWPIVTYLIGSASMEPTLHCGVGPACRGVRPDRVLVNRIAYLFRSPRRGDIVAIRLAMPGTRFCAGPGIYIKRIVALPGEHPPPSSPRHQRVDRRARTLLRGSLTLARDEYFVLGDNRGGSCDSRTFGPVGRDEILGRVSGVVWPLSRVRLQ